MLLLLYTVLNSIFFKNIISITGNCFRDIFMYFPSVPGLPSGSNNSGLSRSQAKIDSFRSLGSDQLYFGLDLVSWQTKRRLDSGQQEFVVTLLCVYYYWVCFLFVGLLLRLIGCKKMVERGTFHLCW